MVAADRRRFVDTLHKFRVARHFSVIERKTSVESQALIFEGERHSGSADEIFVVVVFVRVIQYAVKHACFQVEETERPVFCSNLKLSAEFPLTGKERLEEPGLLGSLTVS